jgi:hypothetical protein
MRDSVQRGATGEDCQATEQPLLVGIQQTVASVDRRSERPLAHRQILRPVAQQLEPAIEPRQQRLG